MITPIKVLIVDDSASVRNLLSRIIDSDPYLTVIGSASDPYIAREKIKQLDPDVLTLDIEMPRMDGITFLKNLMRLRPMPVVMVSSLAVTGADKTLQALEIGAVDYISKPNSRSIVTLDTYADELKAKIRAAAKVQIKPLFTQNQQETSNVDKNLNADAVIKKVVPESFKLTQPIIAIGASTGGTEAIKQVLTGFPKSCAGTVVTQHIPSTFSGAFASRLDTLCGMTVCEAVDGDEIVRGHAYIAPGDQHLMVVRRADKYFCRLDNGSSVNRHKPSVDVLFRSVAQSAGPNATAVILTGMGNDGAMGLKELQDVKASTIAQDKQSSVVWGMPGSAVKLGAADDVLPLNRISERVLELLSLSKTRHSIASLVKRNVGT